MTKNALLSINVFFSIDVFPYKICMIICRMFEIILSIVQARISAAAFNTCAAAWQNSPEKGFLACDDDEEDEDEDEDEDEEANDVLENNDDGENEEDNYDYNDAGKENEDASAENRNAW